jgi:MIR domain
MVAGEIVTDKWTWLLDNVEAVGVVRAIDDFHTSADPDFVKGGGDTFGITPDPNYRHLIRYMRGNNPLPWSRSDSPGLLHCETYPLAPADPAALINRHEPWSLPRKPVEPFAVKLRDGSSRPLQLGDRIKVVGRWVIDHHPEKCDEATAFGERSRCRSEFDPFAIPPRVLRIGQTHVELHPFRWDDIQLVEPLRPGDVASVVVSLAAPLHEEQYLGDGHWLGNEIAGVAGKVSIEASTDDTNYNTQVSARVDLDPPPTPPGPSADLRLVWTESVFKLGEGMDLEAVRKVRLSPDGKLTVTAFVFARNPDGSLASIHNPAKDRSAFQAHYELSWMAVGTPVRYGTTLRLRHVETGYRLHSHLVAYSHPGSSGQQQVTCYAGADDNDLWRVKGPDGGPAALQAGQLVQHGDVVRLEHILTKRNLHSHSDVPSPVTGQQEVTGFGNLGIGDGNDNWRVEVDGGGQWAGQQMRLIHLATNVALHSHNGFSHPVWTSGQQEVTGLSDRDPRDLWFASDFRARDAWFVSQGVPDMVVMGQRQAVTVTISNVGTETWMPGSHRLGSSPANDRTWGLTRVDLPGPVAPGEHAVFSFEVTAPATPGFAPFQWRMLQEGVEWFGEDTPRKHVRVTHEAGPTTTVPDVGDSARRLATELIRAADLQPKFVGAGGIRTFVMNQTPAGGTIVARGSTVTLQMGKLDDQ